MKKQTLFVVVGLTVMGLLLSACGAAPVAETSRASVGSKVDASEVAFTGVVESITDTEIVVDGQVIAITPEMAASANFVVGDVVEVAASVDSAGVVTAAQIELYQDDSSLLEQANASGEISGLDMSGVIEAIDGATITIDGQTYTLTDQAGLLDAFVVGDMVSFEYTVNADNTLSLSEIALAAVETASADDAMDTSMDSSLSMSGVVDAIDSLTITIDGQVYIIADLVGLPSALAVGDTVSFDYTLNADSTMTVTEIELASASGSGMGDGSMGSSSSMSGVIDAIDATTVTIDGQTYALADLIGLPDTLAVGDFVSFDYVVNTDGTMTVTEIELDDSASTGASLGSDDEDSSSTTGDSSDDDNGDQQDDSNDNDEEDESGS